MSETRILNNIKKEFYEMVVEFFNNYSQNKTAVNIELYNNMLNLYKKVNACKSFEEVKQCLNEIQEQLAGLKKIYNSKVDEYKKTKNPETLKDIKDITKVAQGLTDAYSKANELMSKRVKETKKTETQKSKEEKIKPVKKVNLDGINFDIPEIKEMNVLSTQIVSLKEQLSSLDPLSKEATSLRKKINDLCNQRMHIAYEQFGYDGMNYIRQVESLETRYANHEERQSNSEYELTEEQYANRLEELLEVIADLKFNGIKSRYVNVLDTMNNSEKLKTYQEVYSKYMNEYSNLVKSLHNTANPTIYSQADYVVSSTDLLNYLSIYNLKGGYQVFKEHHKTGKIGSEAVTKELYASGLDKIEGFITSFKIISKDLIRNKGGKITISNQNVTKEDMKVDMEQKLADFYKMITKKQQEKTM